MTELYNDMALELWYWLWMNNLPSSPEAVFYSFLGAFDFIITTYIWWYVINIRGSFRVVWFILCSIYDGFLNSVDRVIIIPRVS